MRFPVDGLPPCGLGSDPNDHTCNGHYGPQDAGRGVFDSISNHGVIYALLAAAAVLAGVIFATWLTRKVARMWSGRDRSGIDIKRYDLRPFTDPRSLIGKSDYVECWCCGGFYSSSFSESVCPDCAFDLSDDPDLDGAPLALEDDSEADREDDDEDDDDDDTQDDAARRQGDMFT